MFHSKGIKVTPVLCEFHTVLCMVRPEDLHEEVMTILRTEGTLAAASRTVVTMDIAGFIISLS